MDVMEEEVPEERYVPWEPKQLCILRKWLNGYQPTNLDDDPLPIRPTKLSSKDGLISSLDWASQYLMQKKCPASVITSLLVKINKQELIYPLLNRGNDGDTLHQMHYAISNVDSSVAKMISEEDFAFIYVQITPPMDVSYCGIRNRRNKMEDRSVVLPSVQTMPGKLLSLLPPKFTGKSLPPMDFYAVYDGHNGGEASTFTAANFHFHLLRAIGQQDHPETSESIRKAIVIAAGSVDEEWEKRASIEGDKSGTTFVAGVLTPTSIVVGWAGDSGAVLVRGGVPRQLVNPHKPSREDERQRIMSSGGEVMLLGGIWRVNGALAISRAIGDIDFRGTVIPTPEVVEIRREAEDEFLILGTDGLWDSVTPEAAVQVLKEAVLADPVEVAGLADKLVGVAKDNCSQDNISVIVVCLTSLENLAVKFKGVSGEVGTSNERALLELNAGLLQAVGDGQERDVEVGENGGVPHRNGRVEEDEEVSEAQESESCPPPHVVQPGHDFGTREESVSQTQGNPTNTEVNAVVEPANEDAPPPPQVSELGGARGHQAESVSSPSEPVTPQKKTQGVSSSGMERNANSNTPVKKQTPTRSPKPQEGPSKQTQPKPLVRMIGKTVPGKTGSIQPPPVVKPKVIPPKATSSKTPAQSKTGTTGGIAPKTPKAAQGQSQSGGGGRPKVGGPSIPLLPPTVRGQIVGEKRAGLVGTVAGLGRGIGVVGGGTGAEGGLTTKPKVTAHPRSWNSSVRVVKSPILLNALGDGGQIGRIGVGVAKQPVVTTKSQGLRTKTTSGQSSKHIGVTMKARVPPASTTTSCSSKVAGTGGGGVKARGKEGENVPGPSTSSGKGRPPLTKTPPQPLSINKVGRKEGAKTPTPKTTTGEGEDGGGGESSVPPRGEQPEVNPPSVEDPGEPDAVQESNQDSSQ